MHWIGQNILSSNKKEQLDLVVSEHASMVYRMLQALRSLGLFERAIEEDV